MPMVNSWCLTRGRKGAILLGLLLAWFGQASAQNTMPALGGAVQTSGLSKDDRVAPPYSVLASIQSLPRTNRPVQGLHKAVVILVDFPDYTWDTQQDSNFVNPQGEPGFAGLFGKEYFEAMLFSQQTFKDPFGQSNYSGSMRDYYRENSYAQLDIDGSVTRWYTVEKPYRSYANADQLPGTADDHGFGGGPDNVRSFVREAIRLADPDINYADFDGNGDGFVDALFVIHAGPGAEELYTKNREAHFNYFWSHQSSMAFQTEDGVSVGTYTVEPETGTIGVFCHEYGHVLGLPDLYDVDRSSEGIGEWGLMAGGGWCFVSGDRVGTTPAHLTAWCKIKLGWLQPIDLNQGSSAWQLPPVESNPVAIRLWNSILSTSQDNPSEYFLLENRQNISFDRGLTRRQVELNKPAANGLLIYHIDETIGGNNDESRKRVDVEEATPMMFEQFWIENLDQARNLGSYEILINGNRGDNGDPFPGYLDFNEGMTDFVGLRFKDEFSDTTIPNSRSNRGDPTHISVESIRLEGETVLFQIETDQTVTAVTQDEKTVAVPPMGFTIVPNPVQHSAQFHLTLSLPHNDQDGELSIYNLLGQRVHLIRIMSQQKMVLWDGRNAMGQPLGSGLYFVALRVGAEIKTQKMVVVR